METVLVTCMVVLYVGDYREVLEISAPAMHTEQELWLLDLTNYITSNPKFKYDNTLVQEVNSNMCLFGGKK